MEPQIYRPTSYPISVKGVVVRDGEVLLVKNERDEWELPGGKLDPGESPEQCVVREIQEEVNWNVSVVGLLDAWMYHITPDLDVFIVTYGCTAASSEEPVLSHEHQDIDLFSEREADALRMPDGYKRSVRAWFDRLRDRGAVV